ncbi:hypothetical protein D3C85_1050290 [compost metagenome]
MMPSVVRSVMPVPLLSPESRSPPAALPVAAAEVVLASMPVAAVAAVAALPALAAGLVGLAARAAPIMPVALAAGARAVTEATTARQPTISMVAAAVRPPAVRAVRWVVTPVAGLVALPATAHCLSAAAVAARPMRVPAARAAMPSEPFITPAR